MALHMRLLASLLLLVATSALGAQQSPAVRLINAPEASSAQSLGVVAAVRQLPNGQLLVNDIAKRQLVLFDAALAAATIVADSVSGGANSYGPRAGSLVPYLGDSTLFIDPADLSMFVIDPKGAIARVAAVPRSQDAMMMGSNLNGTPALDSRGRLVYRAGMGRIQMPAGSARGGLAMPEPPDSSAVVRVELASRKLDTAAFFKIAKTKMNMVQNERGVTITTEINPMQMLDDWAVVADGSIAIVRGRDYHVDWVNVDGSMTSSAKIPFEWQRMTDDDKIAVIDSTKSAMERARAAAPGSAGAMGALGAGGQRMVISTFGGDGAPPAGGAAGAPTMPAMTFVNASELPDYRPAFGAGAARADLEGNLWIRTSATRTGAIAGPIYDVVNRAGALVDRVQVPAGRSIVGFGKGGVVYMLARDDKGAWVERTHR
jgi:hypothetical protein